MKELWRALADLIGPLMELMFVGSAVVLIVWIIWRGISG